MNENSSEIKLNKYIDMYLCMCVYIYTCICVCLNYKETKIQTSVVDF